MARYWIGGTGAWNDTTHWSTLSGGSGGAAEPTSSDDVIFDGNSGVGSITTFSGEVCKSLDASTSTITTIGSPASSLTILGGFILKSGVTFAVPTFTLSGSALAQSIHQNDGTITSTSLSIDATGEYILSSDFSSSSLTFILTSGTFDINDFDLTVNNFNSNFLNTRVLSLGSGITTITGSGTVIAINSTNLTFNAETSYLTFTDSSATNKTISSTGDITFYDMNFAGTGTGEFRIFPSSGSNLTVSTLSLSNPVKTLLISSGNKVTFTTLVINGTSGNLNIIKSLTAGSNFMLVKNPLAGNVEIDYVDLKDCYLKHLVYATPALASTTFSMETLTGAATSVTIGDDELSSQITMPFIFNFGGYETDKVKINSNGAIFLDKGGTGSSSGQPLALPTATYSACIAAFWNDLDPSVGGTVKYETLGNVGNRIFVVEFSDVPQYGGTNETTFQIKIFESDHSVEVHVENGPNDEGNNIIQGIQLFDGETVSYVAGRNRTNFTLSNDAQRWTFAETSRLVVGFAGSHSTDSGGNENWYFGDFAGVRALPLLGVG